MTGDTGQVELETCWKEALVSIEYYCVYTHLVEKSFGYTYLVGVIG